jgi:3-hydroxyisobutyrate dehydrogenase-like beta-hydroxyacid dehydrogenase
VSDALAVSPARIGVIGVGEMGRPMVERLMAAGHEVAQAGIAVAPSISELARGAPS